MQTVYRLWIHNYIQTKTVLCPNSVETQQQVRTTTRELVLRIADSLMNAKMTFNLLILVSLLCLTLATGSEQTGLTI